MTAAELIEREGKTRHVRCVRACIGYVSGHIRSTGGKVATFAHPTSGRVWNVYRCENCGAYWPLRSGRRSNVPRLNKDQQIADMLSGFEVREARRRALAKDLLFAVDVTEPEAVLLDRFVAILRAAPAVGERSYYEQMKANAEAGLNRQTTDTPAVGEEG